MRSRHILAMVVLSAVLAKPVPASTLQMNAAVPQDTQRITPGVYATIELDNTLPEPDYRIEAKVEAHAIELPDIKAEMEKIKKDYMDRSLRASDECSGLANAITALLEAKEEGTVFTLRRKVESLRAEAQRKGICPGDIYNAEVVIGRTKRVFDTHLPIEAGHFATVTAYRIVTIDLSSKQVARKVFDAGPLGSIRSNVVLGGLPNKDQRWFTKATDKANEFIVTRETDRDSYDPLAALLLTWEPPGDTRGGSQAFAFRRGPFSGSFAVGLGTETDQPLYLAGYALHFTPRFGVAAGIAGFNQKRLMGIYEDKDVVSTNLTPDQLMDDTFGAGWWMGITIRP